VGASRLRVKPAFLSNQMNQVKAVCSCEHNTRMKISFFISLTGEDMSLSEKSCSYDEIGGTECM